MTQRGLLAQKKGMMQLFLEDGSVVPVTVLESASCHVVQVKHTSVEGYSAVQLGYGEVRAKRVNKPMKGHFERAHVKPLRTLMEVRDLADHETPGEQLTVEMFTPGERIDVVGTSKGKGFAGHHKRHNFHRGPVTHGSMNIRQPGSIGSTDAARTFKGVKMAGHLGDARATVRNLEVVRVDADRQLLLVRGSVPGGKNAVVLVRNAVKEGA